ncbi:hypothetical protein BO78DRAFT_419952 [Aspergillus sclerotiicarbonarius CBS 121057]|uniref:F-box domain-containing protein n=1 Tax=Aspergillus sclerotiicarbonarius (strain CBS 121057 / IBT 28362) TaxID=1448318 RepID=A0A319EMW1_ASPSB|nr:hypothetical protein BO78DRAFT_419952 [Aspergillus sclerotiicarbonarius CBS 121057]
MQRLRALFCKKPQQKPTLTALPPEILLHIATYLDPNDLACLTLCSHGLLDTLGRSSWVDLQNESSMYLVLFLQQLSKDLLHLIYCYYCDCFHLIIELLLGSSKRLFCLYPQDGGRWKSISQAPRGPSYGILIYGQPENTDGSVRHCFSRTPTVANLHYDPPHTSSSYTQRYSISIKTRPDEIAAIPRFTQIPDVKEDGDDDDDDGDEVLRFVRVWSAAVVEYSPDEIERDVLESIHICPHESVAHLAFGPPYPSTYCRSCHIKFVTRIDEQEHQPSLICVEIIREFELFAGLEIFEREASALIRDYMRAVPWSDFSASLGWGSYIMSVIRAMLSFVSRRRNEPSLDCMREMGMPLVHFGISRTDSPST